MKQRKNSTAEARVHVCAHTQTHILMNTHIHVYGSSPSWRFWLGKHTMVDEFFFFYLKRGKTKTSIKRTPVSAEGAPLFKLLYDKYHFCYFDGPRGKDFVAVSHMKHIVKRRGYVRSNHFINLKKISWDS